MIIIVKLPQSEATGRIQVELTALERCVLAVLGSVSGHHGDFISAGRRVKEARLKDSFHVGVPPQRFLSLACG